jgi:hypothetical protein
LRARHFDRLAPPAREAFLLLLREREGRSSGSARKSSSRRRDEFSSLGSIRSRFRLRPRPNMPETNPFGLTNHRLLKMNVRRPRQAFKAKGGYLRAG